MIVIKHECKCDACNGLISTDTIEWSGIGDPRAPYKPLFGFRIGQIEYQLCCECGVKLKNFFKDLCYDYSKCS